MARDLMKSFGDEMLASKLFAATALVGTVTHAFPWRVLEAFGPRNESGFQIGALGIVSAIALVLALVLFLLPLLSEMAPEARKNLGLLLIALPVVAVICQIIFWFGTGETHRTEGLGFTVLVKDPISVGWGFYLSLVFSLATAALGAMRVKVLTSSVLSPA